MNRVNLSWNSIPKREEGGRERGVGVREREGRREGERERDRQTDRDTERDRDRQRHTDR